MRFSVCRNKTRAVNGEHDVLLQQVHIVQDLIVRALQKGGVNAHHRQHALTGQTCRKGHGVLLCHAHVKEPLRRTVRKELQPGAIFHGRGNGADAAVLCSFPRKRLPESRRKRFLGSHLRVGHPVRVKGRYPMVVARVHLGRLISFALFGHNMQKVRAGPLADSAQGPLQFFLIVTIHWPNVLEPHVLKHGRVVHCPSEQCFTLGQGFFQRGAHHRDTVEEAPHIVLGVKICSRRAQVGQIPCQRAHIVGNGHLIVIQDHKQVVQMLDVVHALVDHAACKGTIADDRNHPARLMPDLLGPGHADGQRKRCVAVPRNKGIVLALVRVRKTGNAIQLAQFCKAAASAGEQFVRIALMPHVKNDFVHWRRHHPVQGYRQLHCAEVGRQMTACAGDIPQQKLTDLRTELVYLFFVQTFQIAGLINVVQ